MKPRIKYFNYKPAEKIIIVYLLTNNGFTSYLALQYGYEKLIFRISTESSEFYESFIGKFCRHRMNFLELTFYSNRKHSISAKGKFQFKTINDDILLRNNRDIIRIERNFHLVHFDNVGIGEQFLNYFGILMFFKNIFTNLNQDKMWTDSDSQINLVFRY